MADGLPAAVKRQSGESDVAIAEFTRQVSAEVDAFPKEGALTMALASEDGTPVPGAPDSGEEAVETLQRQLGREKQRNASLLGRLESQLRPMNEVVKQLKEQNALLLQERERYPSPETVKKPAAERFLTEEDMLKLTPDQLDLQAKIARGMTASELERTRGELQVQQRQLEDRIAALEQTAVSRTTGAFWNAVERKVPGAKQANDEASPEWVAFLDEIDSDSGRSRRVLGEAAIVAGDVRRVADLVREYYERQGVEVPERVVSQVRPERAANPASRPATRKPSVRESEIKRFYDDVAKGVYVGRDDERKKLESVIDSALLEGRILRG